MLLIPQIIKIREEKKIRSWYLVALKLVVIFEKSFATEQLENGFQVNNIKDLDCFKYKLPENTVPQH